MTSLLLRGGLSSLAFSCALLATSSASAERVVTHLPFGVRDGSLDATVDTGIQVAPGLYTPRAADQPFAVACDGGADCPVVGLPGRCVRLTETIGACLYGEVPLPDDPSCVGGRGAACADRITDYPSWASLDCDMDGFPNRTDWRVCAAPRVLSLRDDGRPVCTHENLVVEASLCGPLPLVPVAPGGFSVCDRDATSTPFAVCCHDAGDCPPAMGMTPSCVLLDDTDASNVAGACTYRPSDGGGPGLDRSCLDPIAARDGIVPSACFEPAEATYENWANGACDRPCVDGANEVDDAVCGCAPVGVEDAAVAEEDAAVEGEDAAVEGEDAGVEGEDSGVASPDAGGTAFAGGGCRCATGRPRGSFAALAGVAALASILLARRRARRAERVVS